MPRFRNGQPTGRGGSTILTLKQSGDDWGMGDDDDIFGTDIMNMDPHSQEFADAMAAEADKGPPKIPGEVDAQGWSPDFTDSGIQSGTDPEDAEEDAYDRSLLTQGRSLGQGQGASGGEAPKAAKERRVIQKKRTLLT